MKCLVRIIAVFLFFLNYNICVAIDQNSKAQFVPNLYQNFVLNLTNLQDGETLITKEYQELIELTTEPLVNETANALKWRLVPWVLGVLIFYECLHIGR